ncbi:helix-turn-helix domain-containing protein [Streptomyces niveus]|uniref:helix-turn-helix domain-containing protein n=1 Tax=Streptomyces niveus TaxID=193462 RepID=UPI003695C380
MGDFDANLWSHPRLIAAVTGEDREVFRRTAGSGISQMKLGELVGLVQPDVSDIERGQRRVTSVMVSAAHSSRA